MIWQFLSWYLIIQLITVLTVPLAVRLFANLDDRGYAFTKSLGILLIGFVYWFGYSFGLLRNETGGVWLALILIGLLVGTIMGTINGLVITRFNVAPFIATLGMLYVARGFAMLDGIVSQVPHDRALGSEAVVPALRARFGALVARAYGPQDKADALRVRHEVVAWNPPAAFIRRLMDHYVVSLELRAMERDHREAMDHALSEADMARANALSDALRAQRERLGAANLALEEELDLLRQTRAALPAERTD